MTQEDKELLLKDLSARLLYGVICKWTFYDGSERNEQLKELSDLNMFFITKAKDVKVVPYLRPMSSMTEEERKEYKHLVAFSGSPDGAANFVEWLNKKMFAYRTIDGKDMFELGIAVKAPEGMYT